MRAFKRYALHRADAVTANSSVTKQAVLETAPGTSPIEVIPMGVAPAPHLDEAVVAGLRRRYGGAEGPLLAFVGRVVEEKGVGDLVRAVEVLQGRLPDVRAVVIGEGQHRPAFEKLTARLGLSDRISFLGWIPSGEVPGYLAAADALIAPSRRGPDGWIEAQGLSVVEAMSVGTPVIATRSGGVVDAVRDGETGLLVDERSPGQIAGAVERLVGDHDLVERIGLAAERMVRDRFSQEASARAFSSLFDGLIRRSARV